MANDKMNQWRMEGMYYAYDRIKEVGLEEFGKELLVRQRFGAKILHTKKDYREYVDEIVRQASKVTITFCLAVLYDEFDFDTDMCERFMERFKLKASCFTEDYLSWDEHMKIISDEIGLRIRFDE